MDSEPDTDSIDSSLEAARDIERRERDEEIADDLDRTARAADALAERHNEDRR
jgi:hypothetical protein